MKYKILSILCLLILTSSVLYYSYVKEKTLLKNNNIESEIVNTPEITLTPSLVFSSQSVTIGSVIYKITPKNLSADKDVWEFEVTLDTHSGSLDQDLIRIISLIDDQNKQYPPLNWQGDPPGGHHRSGTLIFPSISESGTILLKILDQGEEKNITWERR